MRPSLYVRFGLLVICLSVAISAYAGPVANLQLSGNGGERDALTSSGSPQAVSHEASSIASQINSTSSLSAGTPGLPGTKYGGNGLSTGGDLKPIRPLPLVPSPIPEPGILLDLGMGLAAFVTIWSLKLRRSA
ncbi:MAG: hypothetical protein WAM71_02960 [Candidatus Korobacteraceae bacterium]